MSAGIKMSAAIEAGVFTKAPPQGNLSASRTDACLQGAATDLHDSGLLRGHMPLRP